MSVDNFIPELTRAEMQLAYERAPVVIPTLAAVPEGEIRTGNAVKIVMPGTHTVIDYKAAGRRIEGEDINLDDLTILIDQEKAVADRIDDIDERQAAGSLTQYTDGQGKSLALDADRFVIFTLINEGQLKSSASVDTVAKAKTAVRSLATAHDVAETPEDGRYLLVNAAAKALIVEWLGDSAGVQAAGSELRKNFVGEVSGFTVIWSNKFPEFVDGPAFVSYHETAAAFAGQIAKTEAVRASDGFADVIRSLSVYGAKVTRQASVISAGFDFPEAPETGEGGAIPQG